MLGRPSATAAGVAGGDALGRFWFRSHWHWVTSRHMGRSPFWSKEICWPERVQKTFQNFCGSYRG